MQRLEITARGQPTMSGLIGELFRLAGRSCWLFTFHRIKNEAN